MYIIAFVMITKHFEYRYIGIHLQGQIKLNSPLGIVTNL